MKRTIKAGTTDFNLTVIAYDNTSTSGAGLSGLTHTTSGLILEYRRSGDSSWTQLGVGTGLVAGTLGSYVSGGIVASGSRAGRYQIGIPNGAIAAGATFVEICLRGATNMHPIDIEIQLDAVDYQDATAFGLSRIDATIGSRATQTSLDTVASYIDTEVAAIKSKTDNLPSDPADASDIAASFVTVNNTLSTISGYIDTEVAAIKAKTDNLPANPAAVSDIPTANQNRDAILNADPNAGYTNGSFGDRWIISNSNNRTVKVSGAGAGHVAADLHTSQTDSLTADAITAAAVAKIQNGLALEASSQSILARIGAFTGTGVNTILGFFRALLRSDASITTPSDVGGTYTHTTDSTQAIRDRGDAAWTTGGGGGGSTTVNVLPYTGAVPDRVEGTTIKVFYNELTNVSVGVTDATGAAVTLDAKTLRFCVEDRYGVDVLTLNDGSITRSGSTFTVQIPQSLTDTVGANYRWSLRDLTSSLNTVLIHGQLIVAEAAEDEA